MSASRQKSTLAPLHRGPKNYLHKTRGLFRLDDGKALVGVYLRDRPDEAITIVPMESAFDRGAARLTYTVKPSSIKVLRMDVDD